jgi:hypothetical protein
VQLVASVVDHVSFKFSLQALVTDPPASTLETKERKSITEKKPPMMEPNSRRCIKKYYVYFYTPYYHKKMKSPNKRKQPRIVSDERL